jgi:FkbM family methyltransferase
MLDKPKYWAAEVLKKHPRTWSWVWNILPRITILLPHDKSYYGFRRLAGGQDGLFLDVGANNGMTAAGFRKLNKKYRILSIEANRYHEPALRRLKQRIGSFDYIIAAVGAGHGEVRLYTPIYKGIPIHTHTSSSRDYLEVSLRRDFSPTVVGQIVYDEQIVKVIPLDSLNLQPDIVKIDVEGLDYEVLLGMRQTIDKFRPAIMVEYTPSKTGPIVEFFGERAYDLFIYDENKRAFVAFDEDLGATIWRESGLQLNIYAIPAERRHIATGDFH